jgi:hypothetical protein
MAAYLRSLPLCCAFLCAAAAAVEPADPQAPRYSMFGQGLLYGTYLAPTESRFNPDNALAFIAQRQANAELRVNLSASLSACGASAKLRGQYNRRADADAAFAHGVPAATHATFLNEGSLRCRIGNQAEFSIGREVLQWGSSIFLSPSNPFFIDTGKTNPIQELHGKDSWQVQWFPGAGVTVAAIRNFRQGGKDTDPANFSPTSAVKLDWIGESASGGAIVARRDNGVRRLGLYGTLPYSKAALVYVDLAAGRGNAGWFARPDPGSAAGWRFAQDKLDGNKLFYSLLAGAAYTLESGWTITAEWLSGNEGYDAAERSAYNGAADQAARLLRRHDANAAAATRVLGTALSPNLPYLSRHYLFLQLLRSEWNDKGDVALRWARPIGAGEGAIVSGSLTYYLSNHHQLFLVASRNLGGERSDFGRLIHSSVQTGLRSTF